MNKQYSADKLLANNRTNWPGICKTIERFAVYLHRSQQLFWNQAMTKMRPYEINTSEFDVLAGLRNSAPPHVLTPTELQRSLLITSGGLTKLLYQLEDRGLITRSVQEHDKRSKLVHLSKSGKKMVEQIMKALQKSDRELLDSALTEKEQEQLVKLLGKVTKELEKRDGHFT
jgi:DNA-binding MarR family transcriptional regulator